MSLLLNLQQLLPMFEVYYSAATVTDVDATP